MSDLSCAVLSNTNGREQESYMENRDDEPRFQVGDSVRFRISSPLADVPAVWVTGVVDEIIPREAGHYTYVVRNTLEHAYFVDGSELSVAEPNEPDAADAADAADA